MSQNATATHKKPTRMDWRGGQPLPYELHYLMKLGNLDRRAAAALLAVHGSDRDAINAKLLAMMQR